MTWLRFWCSWCLSFRPNLSSCGNPNSNSHAKKGDPSNLLPKTVTAKGSQQIRATIIHPQFKTPLRFSRKKMSWLLRRHGKICLSVIKTCFMVSRSYNKKTKHSFESPNDDWHAKQLAPNGVFPAGGKNASETGAPSRPSKFPNSHNFGTHCRTQARLLLGKRDLYRYFCLIPLFVYRNSKPIRT